MRSVGASHIGKVRTENQDKIFFHDQPVGNLKNLYIVADGMGGHRAGGKASSFAVERFVELIEESEQTDPIELMKTCIATVNQEIIAESKENEKYAGMGTTFVAATVSDHKVTVMNIGDSRLYVIGQEDTRQITLDHSLVEELIRTGQLDRRKVRFHPEKNIITRALGTGKEAVPDFFEVELQPGEKVLLCSDGLTNMVEDDEIGSIVMRQQFVDRICEQLIDRANYYGGKDNIGVVVIEQSLNEV